MSPELIIMLTDALDMFVFLAVELTILYIVISYAIGVLQEYITNDKVQAMLTSRNGRGYFIAAGLGAITPFCSCSTIPFLKGLFKARAGFGPTIVFLLASPLLNPIVIGILAVTFGIKVAVFYFSIAMIVSISAGFLLEKLGFEKYVKTEAYDENTSSCGSSCNPKRTEKAPAMSENKPLAKSNSCSSKSKANPVVEESPEPNRWMRIWLSTWKDFKKTLPYLLVGVTVGAFIYGFVPTDLIIKYAGENKWYAVPIAAVIGIPLYIRASAVIPLSAGLVQKGMAMGSVMALVIGSAGASLTEVILLRSIFKTQMIAAFLFVVLGMAMTAGYLYSILF